MMMCAQALKTCLVGHVIDEQKIVFATQHSGHGPDLCGKSWGGLGINVDKAATESEVIEAE